MRNLLLLFSLFLISFSSDAQDYPKVDSLVALYPKEFQTIDHLVQKINTDFIIPKEKVRAAFFWICNNVSYDVVFSQEIQKKNLNAFSYKTENERILKEKKIISELSKSAFESKKAVCFGYSALFNELMTRLGFESKLIRGCLKFSPNQIGGDFEINHGWNVVHVNGKWQFVDCTLAAGYVSSNENVFVKHFDSVYFLTSPELFFLNHYPEEDKWLLIENKTKAEFLNNPLYYSDYNLIHSTVVLPKTGVVPSTKTFELVFNNFDFEENYIEYLFSVERKRNLIQLEDAAVTTTIPIEGKTNQLLYILVNGKIAVVYKISN